MALELAAGATGVDAVALCVEWSLPANRGAHGGASAAAAGGGEADTDWWRQPYSRHEVAFLPRPLAGLPSAGAAGAAPRLVEFTAVVEHGALRLEF